MPVAGLALGHHGVTGLHVAQDEGAPVDLVLLVLVQLCVCDRCPSGPGQSTELHCTHRPFLFLPCGPQGHLLTLHAVAIDPPGDLRLGPALCLAV